MRKPVLLIFTNALILIVIFALLTQSLVLVQRIAQVGEMKGKVSVQRSGHGEFFALAKDGMVKTGDVIKTGADGTAEFKWVDGTRWKLMPNTVLTVKKAVANTVKKGEISQLNLSTGKVFIRIVKALAPTSRFEVETPTAVAAVRGTIFSVSVQNGKTEVAVFKGRVQVTGAGKSAPTMIDPGQAALANSPDDIETISSKDQDADFALQTSIVKPELEVKIESLNNGKALIRGKTETGDTLTINGKNVPVMGNGGFLWKAKLKPGLNEWAVVATDKHGETNLLTRSLDNTIATQKCAAATP